MEADATAELLAHQGNYQGAAKVCGSLSSGHQQNLRALLVGDLSVNAQTCARRRG